MDTKQRSLYLQAFSLRGDRLACCIFPASVSYCRRLDKFSVSSPSILMKRVDIRRKEVVERDGRQGGWLGIGLGIRCIVVPPQHSSSLSLLPPIANDLAHRGISRNALPTRVACDG
eukprot:469537-Rhodomonas_salina.2